VASAPPLALLVACGILLAGCGAKAPAAEGPAPPAATATKDPGPAPAASQAFRAATGFQPVSAAVPVSVPGHRTSEFTVAADPTDPARLLAAGMDWDSADATVQCAAFPSADGGRSWSQVQALPGHTGTREDTDPWVAFDGAGRAYLTCTEGGVGLLLGQSADGGRTWEEATVVPTGGLPIKDAVGAFGDGEVYLCFQQGNDLNAMHSLDRGRSWNQFGFGNLGAGCNGVKKGPDGTVYLLWQAGGQLEADNLNPAPPGVGVAVSRDGGAHWDVTHIQDELGAAPANMPSAPQAAAPSFAIHPLNGTVFVAAQQYQNAEVAGPVGSATRAQALYWSSRDHGATFAPFAGPVFPSEACAVCNQVHPTLATDAAGRLFLQVTLANADSSHREVWMAVSNDEGRSWAAVAQIASYDPAPGQPGNLAPDPAGVAQDVQDAASDPASAPGAVQPRANALTWPVFHRDGGEYFGIAAAPGGIVGLWVQPDAAGRNAILARPLQVLEGS
jgi:hypothetical protein